MTTRAVRLPHRSHRSAAATIVRLLDGTHRWGAVSSSVSRYGAMHETIVILPPDTSLARRRWVSASHAVPPVALLMALVAGCIGIGLDVPWHLAFGVPIVVAAALCILCWREASPATRDAVHLAATTSVLIASAEQEAELRRVRRIAHRLRRTEEGVRAGLLPVSDLEREWRDSYELVRRIGELPR